MRKFIFVMMAVIVLFAVPAFPAGIVNDYAEDIGVETFTTNLLGCSSTNIQDCLDILDAMATGHTDGANCSAGNYPLGVDANGAVQSCTADSDTQLTQEQAEDYAGGLVSNATGTHTGVSITYQDATGDMDFIVDHDAALNFDQNEHFLQSAITETGTIVTGVWNGTAILDAYIDNSVNWNAAFTHVGSDGSSHTFLDQSVISGATPTFSATNFSDGGSNAIITTTQETNFETAYTHSQDNSQAHSDYFLNTGDTSTGDNIFNGKVGIGITPTENFHVYKADDIAFKTEVDKTANTFFSGIRMEFEDSNAGTTGFNNFQAVATHSAAGGNYTQNQTNFDMSFLLTGSATNMLTARNLMSQIYIRQADGPYNIGTMASGIFQVSTALDIGGYTHTITNVSALQASAAGGWSNSNATWNVTNMTAFDASTNLGETGATVNVTDVIGIYVRDPFSSGTGTGTKTNVSGIKIDIPTGGTNKFGLWLNGDGAGADVVMGAGKNAKISYDGANLVLSPRVVGTGGVAIGVGAAGVDYKLIFDGETNDGTVTYMEDEDRLDFDGAFKANDYYSGDGSQGITDTTSYWLCTASDCSTTCQVTIKDGLITGCP